MSLLFVALLFGVAYVLMDAGLSFIALVVFLVAGLYALTNRSQASHGGPVATVPQKQRPIIVTSSGGKIPPLMKIVTKNPWAGTDLWEDFTIYMGIVFQWPFRLLTRIFTGKAGKMYKGPDH
ncbi:MAG: hypothetical protein Q8P02_02710 [Candidatus Micrarchaeota archaeon]|nr:hypothetical protein [Candidatus Micrarchaeota archaeon]